MFRVKICGLTTVEDAMFAVDEASADAIGLNFYPKSPRSVSIDEAQPIAAAVGGRALRVGVFVNATAAEIDEAVAAAPLDAVQLHGDESVGLLAELSSDVPVVRAARMSYDGLAPIAAQLTAAEEIGSPYAAVLIDAAGGAGEYGGTGRTADWPRIAEERAMLGDTPLLLAGGLTPDNVAQAIRATVAVGVDTASGVESAPGRKDRELVGRFAQAAHRALAEAQ